MNYGRYNTIIWRTIAVDCAKKLRRFCSQLDFIIRCVASIPPQSFTGDYLYVVHGFKHVDGDGPLKTRALFPQYKEMTRGYLFSNAEKNVAETKETWAPYFEEIAKRTVDTAKIHDRVVLTHATYKQPQREFFVEKLVEGGVSSDRITVVELTIDPVVKARGLYYRTERWAEQTGMTVTELVKSIFDFEGEITEEKYIACKLDSDKKGEEQGVSFDDCPNAKKADVTGRDISHCDNLDAALGIARSTGWTYETICAKVFPLDVERDDEFAANGSMSVFTEIIAERDKSLAIDESEGEEKVKEMKRRRSSIVQAELLVRDLSFASIRDLSEASIAGTKEMAKRRVSLIKTGKIVEE